MKKTKDNIDSQILLRRIVSEEIYSVNRNHEILSGFYRPLINMSISIICVKKTFC